MRHHRDGRSDPQANFMQFVNRLLIASIFAAATVLAYGPALASQCPLAIQSLTLAGKGAGGKAVMYSVAADLLGSTPMSAALVIGTRSGTTALDWPNITLSTPAPSLHAPSASGTPTPVPPQLANMSFERKSDDVLDAAVTTAGGIRCTLPAIRLSNTTAEIPVVTVYDEAKYHSALPRESPLDHIPMITNAMFAKKAPLQYPNLAQDEDISGTVLIGLVIGPSGKAQYAWVRARDVSAGGDTMLDGPAIWSALNSTYVPRLADGRPTSSTYDIQYTYVLDDPANHNVDDTKMSELNLLKQCPVIMETLRVSVSNGSDHTQWYTFGVDAKGSELPTSVVIGVRDAQKKSTGLIWNPIPLHQDAGAPLWWSAEGSFNWKGAPITLAWVDQATLSNGTIIVCKPVSDAPFNLADGTEFPRYVTGDPLPLLSMQQVKPAAFTHEVWPQYPLGPLGVREAGYAVVQTVVDEGGTIREAFLTQSSGVRSLDSAALYAATSSDYRPASSDAVALYEAVYQFVP